MHEFSSEERPYENDEEEAENVAQKEESISSPHLNPDWLKHLKANFKTIVVDQCSMKVKQAVEKNASIKKQSEFREVRMALIHRTIEHVSEVHGGVTKPRLREMREIAHELGYIYPAMFKDENPGTKGYGLGGKKGLEGLPLQMLDILRNQEGRRDKKEGDGDSEVKKKGKRKYIYGKAISNLFLSLNMESIEF